MNGSVGLHRPGTSPVHRLPAGVKLAALAVAGIGSVLVDRPVHVAAGLVAVLAGYAVARIPARLVWASVRPLLWVFVPLAAFQVLAVGWERACVIVGVLLALVMLADLVTFTTRTTDLVDVVVAIGRRLRFLGVDPERLGLLLSLGIRSVPLVLDLAARVREAQHARGQATSVRAFAVPLVVGALRRADEIGDALAARGAD
jgi:biotin transport system permease protein